LDNVRAEKDERKEFYKHIGYGLALAFAGLLMCYMSYTQATRTEFSFTDIFTGLIVAGIIVMIRGFILFRK
jgi:vacuolar-type H+-ATPase subunit I/STV1